MKTSVLKDVETMIFYDDGTDSTEEDGIPVNLLRCKSKKEFMATCQNSHGAELYIKGQFNGAGVAFRIDFSSKFTIYLTCEEYSKDVVPSLEEELHLI
jgi:hypothetical protein